MKRALLISVVGGLAWLLSAGSAEAQTRRIRGSNWRQSDRGGVDHQGSPQQFALELRGGPYYPAVDEEFGSAKPYQKFFGDAGLYHFGIEFDWQALRIPWVGTFGPGFGVGYSSASGSAFIEGTYGKANETKAGATSLTILPMHVSAVLRLDELMRRTRIPIVPYGKVGLGAGLWWVENGTGTSQVKASDGSEIAGRGLSYGVHWALGGMFALDWLGQRSMSALDQETGINHVYLFGEWMNQNLGLGTGQMHVGTSTWMVGMTFEM